MAEAQPELVITTGTAGGIGTATCLGDVFVVSNAKFNCTKDFQETSPGPSSASKGPAIAASGWSIELSESSPKDPAALRMPHTSDPRRPATRSLSQGGDVETVDYFGFADTDDSYGIVKNDPLAHTEEMDDATLPLALSLVSALQNTSLALHPQRQ